MSRTKRPSPAPTQPTLPVLPPPVTSKFTPSAALRVVMPLPSRSSTMGVTAINALTWAEFMAAMSWVWKAAYCAVVMAWMSAVSRPAICAVVKATIWSVVSTCACAVVKAAI